MHLLGIVRAIVLTYLLGRTFAGVAAAVLLVTLVIGPISNRQTGHSNLLGADFDRLLDKKAMARLHAFDIETP